MNYSRMHLPGAAKASFGCFLALLQLLTIPLYAGAEESGSAGSSTTTPIKGGVVKVEVTLNDLRDARLDVSRVRKAIANLYDEVTRQQVTMNYNPNVIGTTMITVPTPSFSGQFLPARRKWVQASMAEITPIMNLFKEDVDIAIESNRQTEVSEGTREELNPLRDEIFASIKTAFNTFKELEGFTGSSSYDNGSIAIKTKDLNNQMKTLDKSLKKGVSILQKEAKSSKKQKDA